MGWLLFPSPPHDLTPYVNKLCLGSLKKLITQAEMLEYGDSLVEELLEGHERFSPSAASKALASWRSAVSKPSVNQP
jgi:hypothetical protein